MSRQSATLLALILLAISAPAQTLRRVPLWRSGIYSDAVGPANLIVKDVYGSPVPEIVSCSGGAAFALTKSGSVYRPVWYSGNVACAGVAAGDVNNDGVPEIIVGTAPGGAAAGAVLIFSPDRFGPARASVVLPGTQQVTDIALGNVDGDAAIEIVVLTSANAFVYDAATLALEWTATGRGGNSVAIGDLENDGLAEIVVNGSQGHVLSASTQSLKWGYVGGFGSLMALGDVDSDGKAEIIGATSSNVTIINGDTQTTSSFTLSGYYTYAQALAVGDGNNDGVVEIVTGDDQWGEIHGWSVTGTQLWYVNNPEHGVSGVAIGDPDGDGVNEAVWGAGWTSSGTDSVFVGNTTTHLVEWQATDLDGPLRATMADLDQDGQLEVLVLYPTSDSGYDGGILQVMNLTGAVEATIPNVTPSFGSGMRVLTGQLDSDAALEILVGGTDYWSGSALKAYDGVTLTSQWTAPSGLNSAGVAIVNIDGDPVSEIIVGSSDNRVEILNGASNFVQNSTPVLDGYIQDIAVADVNNDAVADIVVATSAGFYVFRASDLLERLHVTQSGTKKVAARTGEFAVAFDTTLATFNGSTNAEQWRCTAISYAQRMQYATLSGAQWLAVGGQSSLDLYPGGGSTCPTKVPLENAVTYLSDFEITDAGADGVPEVVLTTQYSAEVDLVGVSSELRGDVDGDGQVLDADMTALGSFLYGQAAPPHVGADVNGDFTVTPEDLIYLINYRRGTGAPPP